MELKEGVVMAGEGDAEGDGWATFRFVAIEMKN